MDNSDGVKPLALTFEGLGECLKHFLAAAPTSDREPVFMVHPSTKEIFERAWDRVCAAPGGPKIDPSSAAQLREHKDRGYSSCSDSDHSKKFRMDNESIDLERAEEEKKEHPKSRGAR